MIARTVLVRVRVRGNGWFRRQMVALLLREYTRDIWSEITCSA